MSRTVVPPDRVARVCLALLACGLLVGLVGYVVLGHRSALTIQRVFITTALLGWLVAVVAGRTRR